MAVNSAFPQDANMAANAISKTTCLIVRLLCPFRYTRWTAIAKSGTRGGCVTWPTRAAAANGADTVNLNKLDLTSGFGRRKIWIVKVYPSVLLIILAAGTLASCKNSKAREIRGNITGTVIDGLYGTVINGASVYSVQDTGNIGTTNASGVYRVDALPAMRQIVRAEMAGYNTEEELATVPKQGTLSGLNFILLPTAYAADKIVMILTWGDEPLDMDSHLWVPEGSPYREIAYFDTGDPNATPFAALDLDDVDGHGPETTAIRYLSGNLDFNGVYRYFVHNYSEMPAITSSNAQVKVYVNGVRTKTYEVPTSGTGEYWHVFDLQGGVISDVNTLAMGTLPNP